MNLENTLAKIINYAAQITEPEEIILFGSMITGRANVYSDIDLLIISREGIDKKGSATKIKDHVNQYSLKTDVLIYTRSEAEKERTKANSFVSAIYKFGKIVYKKVE